MEIGMVGSTAAAGELIRRPIVGMVGSTAATGKIRRPIMDGKIGIANRWGGGAREGTK